MLAGIGAMSIASEAPPWALLMQQAAPGLGLGPTPAASGVAGALDVADGPPRAAATGAAAVAPPAWWGGVPRQQGQAVRARPSSRQGSSKRCKTSQFRGVASTENGLWRCRIRFGKQTVHLGRRALEAGGVRALGAGRLGEGRRGGGGGGGGAHAQRRSCGLAPGRPTDTRRSPLYQGTHAT
jgi:hypothetical protein